MKVIKGGKMYASGDVRVDLANFPDVNPSAISYGYTYSHAARRGLKRAPQGWSVGSVEYEASITLSLDMIREFEKIAPMGNIVKIPPFPLIISFFNEMNELIIDNLMVKFTGNGRDVEADNDNGLEREYELFVTFWEGID